MMEKIQNPAAENLYRALLGLESAEECAAFLEDICTRKEVQDLSQRLQVAEMLHAGKNYMEISRATGASTATICRVNKCLLYGAGGYRRVLSKKAGETEAKGENAHET